MLLLPFLLLTADLGRCCLVCPCKLWTCTSTPQRLHSFHHTLVASASICVLRFCCFFICCHSCSYVVACCHSLLLRVPPRSSKLRSSPLPSVASPADGPPHSSELGSSPLPLSSRAVCCWTCFLFPVVVFVVSCCVGLLPKCSLLLLVGAHLDASRITAPLPWTDSRQCCLSCCSTRLFLYCWILAQAKTRLDSRPKCCTERTSAQPTCWERVLSFNSINRYIYIYIM